MANLESDLKAIDAEIKAINKLKSTYGSLLETEKTINKNIIYSTSVRKRYTDVITAAENAQKDLLEKEEKLSSIIQSSSAGIKTQGKNYKNLRKKTDDLFKAQKVLFIAGKKGTAEYKKNSRNIRENIRSMQDASSAVQQYKKDMNAAVVETQKITQSAADMDKTFSDLNKLDNKKIKSSDDLNKLVDQRLKIMEKQYDIQEKSGTLTKEESKALKSKLKETEAIFDMYGMDMKKRVSSTVHPMIDELTKEAAQLSDPKKMGSKNKKVRGEEKARSIAAAQDRKGASLGGAQLNNLKTLFSTKSGFGDKMAAVKSYKSAGQDMGKLNDAMKLTGKGALGAVNMFKMLAGALKSLGTLGWIGLILQGVTAIASAVNRLDKFLKGFNQTFAKLQGPSVMMGDVGGSMDTFTDSIFNLQRNLKLGLKSEEIVGMFQGVSEAGMSLQGVMQSVSGGYNKLIEDAAKVHLDFGVSMDEAGAMLGEQMTDLRSTVDESAKSFKVLSYDASIAGIQSQKFYQATYAAAEALSFYGKFLDVASNTLKNFQKQGGMGFKDAQQQTQEMTNLFKNMDSNMRVAFMEMSGGVEAYRKDFQKMEADSAAAIKKHLTSIGDKRKELAAAKGKEDKEAVARLTSEIAAEESQLTTLQKTYANASAAAKSNAMDMAMYLEMLSDKTGDKMGEYLKRLRSEHGPDVFSNTRATVEHMKTVLQVSEEFAKKMIMGLQTSREGIKQMGKDLKDILPDSKDSAFRDEFQKIITDSTVDGKMNMKAIRSGLLATKKVEEKDLDLIMQYMEQFPKSVQEFVKVGFETFDKDINNITLTELGNVAKVTGEGTTDMNKRLDDLVNNTHTIEDFIGISKENAEYFLAGNNLQKGAALAAVQTAKTAGNILSFITGRWGKGDEKILRSYENNDSYRGLKGIGSSLKLLEAAKKETTDKGEQGEYQKEIDRLKIESDKREARLRKRYSADIANQLINTASEAANDEARKKFDEKVATEQKIQAKRDEAAKVKDTDPKAAAKLMAEASKIQRDFAINKSYMSYSTKPIKLVLKESPKDKSTEVTTEPVAPVKDFKATASGYALLSKGDVVVNARNMSAGIGGDYGAFAGAATSEMMRYLDPVKNSSKVPAPSIPVNISIGSVSGNPEEFLKSIKPAIEQAFERMYFEKQKRT